MRRRALLQASLVAIGFLTSSARAENADTVADVRCIVAAMMSAARLGDQASQNANQIEVVYYLGRIDGREPQFDFESHIEDQASKMTWQDAGRENIRCGKALTARGAFLTEVGKDMMQRGRQPSAPH